MVVAVLVIWLSVSYLLMPGWWKVRSSRHPALTNGPRITVTSAGIPGDPLNLAIIGSENDLVSAMLAGQLPKPSTRSEWRR
jgi:hypothetical protein